MEDNDLLVEGVKEDSIKEEKSGVSMYTHRLLVRSMSV